MRLVLSQTSWHNKFCVKATVWAAKTNLHKQTESGSKSKTPQREVSLLFKKAVMCLLDIDLYSNASTWNHFGANADVFYNSLISRNER